VAYRRIDSNISILVSAPRRKQQFSSIVKKKKKIQEPKPEFSYVNAAFLAAPREQVDAAKVEIMQPHVVSNKSANPTPKMRRPASGAQRTFTVTDAECLSRRTITICKIQEANKL
jgi:hypothetical protein